MICPDCGRENQDSAKFCKNCGRSLNPVSTMKTINSQENGSSIKSNYNQNNQRSNDSIFNESQQSSKGGDNKNLIIICLTIIICAVLIAGAFVYMSNSDNSGTDDADLESNINLPDTVSNDSDNLNDDNNDDVSTTTTTKNMNIQGGSFSTGSGASDKTYCTVYVGSEYAGEKVKIAVLYSYEGYDLNQGKLVSKTVGSDGSITVATADPLDYYPDFAIITLEDSSGNTLDEEYVSLSAKDGKQTF